MTAKRAPVNATIAYCESNDSLWWILILSTYTNETVAGP